MADTDPLALDAAAVPAVVAVVVSHDPGPWLEECVASLASQDYPNLSVLILDAGSAEDPTRRVAEVMPGAFVRRLGHNPGYAAAANDVLEVVEGASHLLLCHDDVALDPDAVRMLVEEAYRSNAGIVAPKLVDWDAPGVLLEVGSSADKMGLAVPIVERGELDQEQHDGVRDVFTAPSACMLVRADLFRSLGGFDPAMVFCGEDVDLSWRAQIAGARVMVVPAARVRHRESSQKGERLPPGVKAANELEVLRLRHGLRSLLKSYGPLHRLRVLPQALTVSLFRIVAALVTGKPRVAGGIVAAWRWNLTKANRSTLKSARRRIRDSRAMSDSEVRRLQSRGTAGLNDFAREHHLPVVDQDRLVEAANRGVAAAFRPSATLVAATLVGLLIAFGSRSILSGELSSVGEQLAPSAGPLDMLRLFATAWRPVGLGGEGFAPPALALLGVAGSLLLGALGLLQKIVVIGLLPLGLVGAVQMARPMDSSRARVTALVVYAAIPLPWNALATGRWSGLIVWALVPWAVAALVAVGDGEWSARRTAVGLGIAVAVASALAPAALVVVLVAALGLWAGSALAGAEGRFPGAVVGVGAAAAGIGFLLLLPWSGSVLLAPPEPLGGLSFEALLRFHTGPLGGPPAGLAWMVAAALPLVIGRSWRLSWAAAAWGMAMAGWLLAWVVVRGWAPLPLRSPEPALALASAGLALAAALGASAFERDLPAYKFGWRQIGPPAAALAVFIGTLPVLGATFGGRWGQPQRDLAGVLSFLEEPARASQGDFKILWLGRPGSVPGHPWELPGFGRTAYTLSRNGAPGLTDLWPGVPPGATAAIPQALHLAADGDTTQMGRMLAVMGVRYVAVAQRAAPGARLTAAPSDLIEALDRQVDLGRIEAEEALILYENAAWLPARTVLPGGTVLEGDLERATAADLTGAAPALPEGNDDVPLGFSGELDGGTRLLLAESPSANWRLSTEGEDRASRETAFGVANVWDVEVGGQSRLSYSSPLWFWLIPLAQLTAWALAGWWVWKSWASRRALRRRGGVS